MSKKKFYHLFITYDGILDPLGESQILPYIKSIKNSRRKMSILSFEKKKNFKDQKIYFMKKDLLKLNIYWKYNKFSENFGKFGKIYDLIKMFLISIDIVLSKNIKIIHCRSHIPSLVGLILKKIFKIKLIFDFRGLWVEERFDYNIWYKKNILHKFYFKIFKYLELKILNNSDYIICLTNSIKPYLNKLLFKNVPINVIPCCADYNFFKKRKISKNLVKKKLKITNDSIVIGYAGSINKVYLIKKMILFFINLKKIKKKLTFIFVTPHINELKKIIDRNFDKEIYQSIKIFEADRKNVPYYLSSFDVMVSFIKKSFSRKAMSPTKMFESFAAGVPFICNKGIGDVDSIMNKYKTGVLAEIESINDKKKNLEILKKCQKIKSSHIIQKTKPYYDISFAKVRYNRIYDFLENNEK